MADPKDWASIGMMRKTGGSERDKALSKDMQAYRAMRKQGLQPPRIDGCAELQTRAHDQMEITHGTILTPEQRKEAKEGIERARELTE